MGVFVVLAGLLVITHSPRYQDRFVVIDVLMLVLQPLYRPTLSAEPDLDYSCSLFGGFTVLSTKALSSLLSSVYFEAFTLPISWYMLVVLVATSVCQIKYLNKALQSFESRVSSIVTVV
jgi:hypothetical protein